ncbi:MAG: magnesium transporter CorA family protein [Nocardioidaceae bacterium]
MARTRLYRNGVLVAENFPAAEVSDHLNDPTATVWLDLLSPSEADFATIREELNLHELAVEDVFDRHQRPKLDRYDTHAFMTAYAVRLDPATGILTMSELAAFITKHALVTVRHDQDFDVDAVVARWDDSAELAKSGISYLLHGLVDYVVDGQFDAIQTLDDQIEELEDRMFDDRPEQADLQRRALALRKSLVAVRRVVLPMREVVNTLMRRDLHLIDEPMQPYFQDVYDHVLRVTEWTESLRDLVTTLRETQLNIQANRLNAIMKKVTGWAAIIAVPTAITGFYGQNIPFPGSQQTWGFWTSTALVIAMSGGLYVLFRRRDWL